MSNQTSIYAKYLLLIAGEEFESWDEHGVVNSSDERLIEHHVAVHTDGAERLIEEFMVSKSLFAVGLVDFLSREIEFSRVELEHWIVGNDLLVLLVLVEILGAAVDLEGHVVRVEAALPAFLSKLAHSFLLIPLGGISRRFFVINCFNSFEIIKQRRPSGLLLPPPDSLADLFSCLSVSRDKSIHARDLPAVALIRHLRSINSQTTTACLPTNSSPR